MILYPATPRDNRVIDPFEAPVNQNFVGWRWEAITFTKEDRKQPDFEMHVLRHLKQLKNA